MNKNMLRNIIAIAVSIIVSIGLIIFASVITKNQIEANKQKEQAAKYESIMPGIKGFKVIKKNAEDLTSVLEKIEASDGSKVMGYIITAEEKNTYGSIEIIVGIQLDGTIVGAQFLEIDQSLNVDRSKQNITKFVGLKIGESPASSDIVSGATITLGSVQKLMNDIKITFTRLTGGETDPYELWFGKDYEIIQDNTFTPTEIVQSLELIKDANGSIVGFRLTGEASGVKEGYPSDPSDFGTIKLNLVIDTNSTIKQIELLENNHSGFTSAKITPYLEKFADVQLGNANGVMIENKELTSGATNSRTLIDQIIQALLEKAPSSILEYYFGKDTIISDDESFEATTYVTKRQVITNLEGDVLGYIFTASGLGMFETEAPMDKKRITIEMTMLKSGVIVSTNLDSEHSSWTIERINQYLTKLNGLNIANVDSFDADFGSITSGATNSKNLVNILLEAISEVLSA